MSGHQQRDYLQQKLLKTYFLHICNQWEVASKVLSSQACGKYCNMKKMKWLYHEKKLRY
jgi:hypothetical protein